MPAAMCCGTSSAGIAGGVAPLGCGSGEIGTGVVLRVVILVVVLRDVGVPDVSVRTVSQDAGGTSCVAGSAGVAGGVERATTV